MGIVIRILGMYDSLVPRNSIYCQFWYKNTSEPIISQTKESSLIFNKTWGNYYPGAILPYLLTCPIPVEVSDLGNQMK